MNHDGLFASVDAGFVGSFHEYHCLQNSDLCFKLGNSFRKDNPDEVKEYGLTDPVLMCIEISVLRAVGVREIPADGNAVRIGP